MKAQCADSLECCCIVVANDEGSDPLIGKGFLRQASVRARRIASPTNVLVSGREEDRGVWEGPLWFTRPANRFVSERGVPVSLSAAAAVLAVAARSPSRLVTILPSNFWVARECVLADAIGRALASLQRDSGTVATLGMSDSHSGADEDYLVLGPASAQLGAAILARAKRPGPLAAKQLIKEGALVASGILIGQAQAFAARVHKYWPDLAQELTNAVGADGSAEAEHRLSGEAYQVISRSFGGSIGLSPPTFPMRAFRVQGSGWCTRKRLSDLRPAPAPELRASSGGPGSIRAEWPN